MPCKNRANNTKQILDELTKQKQAFPQTEIIVVENGSDEDMSFLNEYDIVLIHSDMANVSNARNMALDICTGDYICFIDNDDMVLPEYLESIYNAIQDNYDFVTWQWYSDDTYVEMSDLDIKNPLKHNWALWGYCFKKELWNNMKFPCEKSYGEDRIIFDIITEDKKGYFIKKPLYKYKWYNNTDSLCHLYHALHSDES